MSALKMIWAGTPPEKSTPAVERTTMPGFASLAVVPAAMTCTVRGSEAVVPAEYSAAVGSAPAGEATRSHDVPSRFVSS